MVDKKDQSPVKGEPLEDLTKLFNLTLIQEKLLSLSKSPNAPITQYLLVVSEFFVLLGKLGKLVDLAIEGMALIRCQGQARHHIQRLKTARTQRPHHHQRHPRRNAPQHTPTQWRQHEEAPHHARQQVYAL
jgi:hypothetical protein